jgi:hypothetical protein
MVHINRVHPGQILYQVKNFDVIAKEVIRAEIDHIHFNHHLEPAKGNALNNLFYNEGDALKCLKEKLLLKLEETESKLRGLGRCSR